MAKTEITNSGGKSVPGPRDVFAAMRDKMDRMFERFEHGWPRWQRLFPRSGKLTIPELEARENTNSILVEAKLPGVEEKDVSVALADGTLTIKGQKKHVKDEKGESYYLAERSFGSFERAIRLPDTVDEAKVEARFDNGVLKLTAAKSPRRRGSSEKLRSRRPEQDGRLIAGSVDRRAFSHLLS